MWTNTGTLFFKAPEIFDLGRYSIEVDMWSLGVLLFTMLLGRLPFYDIKYYREIKNIYIIFYILLLFFLNSIKNSKKKNLFNKKIK